QIPPEQLFPIENRVLTIRHPPHISLFSAFLNSRQNPTFLNCLSHPAFLRIPLTPSLLPLLLASTFPAAHAGISPPCLGFLPCVLPEQNLHIAYSPTILLFHPANEVCFE